MKVLIIGGTGNISTAITKLLLKRGEDVTVYNRGHSIVEGARNLNGDRTDFRFFESQMKEEGFYDCVIDMICYKPEEAESTVRAFSGRTRQFIFCSTVDTFKKPAISYPITENSVRSADKAFGYAYNKVLCEEIFEKAHKEGCFQLTTIRPAATYNDTCSPISFLGSGRYLLRRIREGKPVIVLGDGSSLWVSSHRDDVALAFANAVRNPVTYGKSYNVTGDEFITWEEYYSTLARVMKAPEIRFLPMPTELLYKLAPKSAEWSMLNFRFNNIFDNSLSKKELGYKYTINWEEGARRMIASQDKLGAIDNSEEHPLYQLIVEKYTKAWNQLTADLADIEKI